jgi:3-oxoacyl-[acyl-carrier protein] reductase
MRNTKATMSTTVVTMRDVFGSMARTIPCFAKEEQTGILPNRKRNGNYAEGGAMLLSNRTAVVTGGARGIGREIVLAFLREGATVEFFDLREGDHLAEYEAVAAQHGGDVRFREVNVTDETAVAEAIESVHQESGGLDVLVNNAGITRDGLIFRMKEEDWDAVLNVNLKSAFLCSKAASKLMIKRRTGSIINVASIVGVIGNAGQVNYSASKAGLIGLTKSLAREVASRGVRVNAVAPGFIETPMTEQLNEEQRNRLFEQIPMGRMGTPEEVAKVIVFLASDLASYVTGHVVHITGGLGM